LKRKIDIISVSTLAEIPTLQEIRAIPRERKLKIIFKDKLKSQREEVGAKLKKELVNFQVGIHTIEPEINIAKLISDKEIEENQEFFEKCAKDYRQLGEELLYKLSDKLGLELNKDFPMETFNELKLDDRQIGEVENWRYFIHGIHCEFKSKITGQTIEVPLTFGLEFGDLDPYFFTTFIKSTPNYHPLPVEIFENFAYGVRINEKMISLGKFEKIASNDRNYFGIVVVDRQKVEIKSYQELNKFKEKNKVNKKAKFNFWKFVGLKK